MALDFKSSKEVELYHEKLGLSKKFCATPFTTLLLEPDGKVGACRQKGSNFPVGQIQNQSLEEIWNGQFIKNWRQEFINGDPQICKTDTKDKECHHCPDYGQLIDSAEIAVHQNKKPSRLAFNFNGHCNLECKMCDVWQKPNGLYDELKFWDQLNNWIPDLEEIELLSGEPFIQKDTYKLIDLISIQKPDAKWIITTNANWILNSTIKEKLNKIKFKNIIISLDSTNELTYSKIRRKGDFHKAINTLRQLKVYETERISMGHSPLNIKINFLFQRDNWQELGLISEFSKTENVDCFRTFLYVPSELSLLTLSSEEKQSILDWYFKHIDVDNLKNCMRVIRPLIDSLDKIHRVYYIKEFHEKMGLL